MVRPSGTRALAHAVWAGRCRTMSCELGLVAGRWRAVNAPHLVALVRTGATFEKGVLVERDDERTPADGHESGGHQQVA